MCDLDEDAVVLDPYMGSGSSAVAAVLLGIHYIGYEISHDYIRLAQARIRKERMQQRMWPRKINNAKRTKYAVRDLFGANRVDSSKHS